MRQYSKSILLFIFYRLPVVALCGAIFWQSSYPGIIKEPLFPYDDKVLHFLVYGLLAFLTARNVAADKPTRSTSKIAFISIVFCSLYGLSDEIHQAFVPTRQASVADFIADCLGSGTGAWTYIKLFINRSKTRV